MEDRLYSFFVCLLTFLKATVLEVQTWLHTRVQPSLFSVLIALQCVLYIKGCIYSNLPHAQAHFCSSTFAHDVPLQLGIHFPSSSLGYIHLSIWLALIQEPTPGLGVPGAQVTKWHLLLDHSPCAPTSPACLTAGTRSSVGSWCPRLCSSLPSTEQRSWVLLVYIGKRLFFLNKT